MAQSTQATPAVVQRMNKNIIKNNEKLNTD